MLFRTLLTGLTVLLLTAGSTARSAPPAGKPAAKAFKSVPGRFSIIGPGVPQEKKTTVQTAAGPVVATMYSFGSGTKSWVASYADYPAALVTKGDPKAMLNGVRDGFVRNVKGTLIEDRAVSLKQSPGREFRVSTESDLVLLTRAYLVGNRLYQIIVAAPKGSFDDAGAKKFLNSFALLK